MVHVFFFIAQVIFLVPRLSVLVRDQTIRPPVFFMMTLLPSTVFLILEEPWFLGNTQTTNHSKVEFETWKFETSKKRSKVEIYSTHIHLHQPHTLDHPTSHHHGGKWWRCTWGKKGVEFFFGTFWRHRMLFLVGWHAVVTWGCLGIYEVL